LKVDYKAAEEQILHRLHTELAPQLSYHGVHHTLDVLEAAMMLAEQEGVEGEDLQLLRLAVLYHDSGFIISNKNHEEISCGLAKEQLPAYGINAESMERIIGMIMATRIPQTANNLLEQIIADADLDYLGRDDFYSIGSTLFAEFKWQGIVSNEEEWNRLQLKFLSSHHYFTSTAIRLRKERKEMHTREIGKMVEGYL